MAKAGIPLQQYQSLTSLTVELGQFGTGINIATDAINQKIGRELIAPSGLLNDFLRDRDSELRALLDTYLKANDLD